MEISDRDLQKVLQEVQKLCQTEGRNTGKIGLAPLPNVASALPGRGCYAALGALNKLELQGLVRMTPKGATLPEREL